MGRQPAEKGFGEGWRAEVAEQAISHSVNHPIRLDCLAILIDRMASATGIGKALNIETQTASHQIRQLYADGVVELVDVRIVAGMNFKRGEPGEFKLRPTA